MSLSETESSVGLLVSRIRLHVADDDLPAAVEACRSLNLLLDDGTLSVAGISGVRDEVEQLKRLALQRRADHRRDLLEITGKRQAAAAYQNAV